MPDRLTLSRRKGWRLPEVRGLVDALETLHVAATLLADRSGLRDCDDALDESRAALAAMKGDAK